MAGTAEPLAKFRYILPGLFCPPAEMADFLLPSWRWSAIAMVNKTKPFLLIDKRGQNTVYLRYGESRNDAKLFTLIVTPPYVAARINKEFPSHEDVMAYVDTHAEEMRTIALSKYERGFATETLL
jgi:hypothetical protein